MPEPCGACTAATTAACGCLCHWPERVAPLQVRCELIAMPNGAEPAAWYWGVSVRLWSQQRLEAMGLN